MTERRVFADRAEAGELLAARLGAYGGARVLGLPRGGVIVAAPIAARLKGPLGVVIVRKIGTPGQRELAMGALALWGPDTAVVRNEHIRAAAGITDEQFEAALQREAAEARRRDDDWGGVSIEVQGADVVLVDDGLATGATMHAAIEVMRRASAGRVIVAVPVGAPAELRELSRTVDEVVYLSAPTPFHSVGAHYADFSQVADETVAQVLARARARSS
jgi:putative phosphoribosyl transferase